MAASAGSHHFAGGVICFRKNIKEQKKMKNPLIVLGLLYLAWGNVLALQTSLYYMPMQLNECTSRTLCEVPTQGGGHTHGESEVHCWAFMPQLTVPAEVKLVGTDGRLVGDELCIGDKFKVQSSLRDGEYDGYGGEVWQISGYESPPVYWINNMGDAVKEVIGCPNRNPASNYISEFSKRMYTFNIPSGGVAPDPYGAAPAPMGCQQQSGDFLQRTSLPLNGGMACSIGTGKSSSAGIVKNGDYYIVESAGDINFSSSTEVDCLFYYDKRNFVNPPAGSLVMGIGVPTSFGSGGIPMDIGSYSGGLMEKMYYDAATKNAVCNKLNLTWFKAGDISYKKNIKVVGKANPAIEISVIGAQDVALDRESNLKIIIKNTGDSVVGISDISSKAPHRLISCDSRKIAPGISSECILAVTPAGGTGVDVSVSYDYASCGKTYRGVSSKDILKSKIIRPKASSQTFMIGVHGACENSYYECHSVSGGLHLGYKCFKQGEYYTPSLGRVLLDYDLSSLGSGLDILSAGIKINPVSVSRPQDVSVYQFAENDLTTTCYPGGDICTKPYCAECMPLVENNGKALATKRVNGPGAYSLDVSDAVKTTYGANNPDLFLQLAGQEDAWAVENKGSCGVENDWQKYDLEISEGAAYLEVVYR
jgi:hypothetical protein